MSAQYVSLVVDLFRASGQATSQGRAVISPSVTLPDPADQMLIGPDPVIVPLSAGSRPQVDLVSTDSVGPQTDGGWTYGISFPGVPGSPAPFSFYLPATGGSVQYLSALAQVPAVTPMAQYVPLPPAPPASVTYVLGLDSADPLITEWVPPSGGGGGTVDTVFGRAGNVVAQSGDYAVAQVTGAASTTSVTSAVAAETTRAETAEGSLSTAIGNEVTRAEAAEALLAPKASPAFSGTPTAPTASALTGTTQVATTAYADAAVSAEKTRAQAAESGNATAIGNEVTRAEAAEALLAPLASPGFTGTPTAPTASPGTSTTQLATTAYAAEAASTAQSAAETFATNAVAAEATRATTAEGLLAPKASPAFTGTPLAPTASPGTSTTQLATTNFATTAATTAQSNAETFATGAATTAQSNAEAASYPVTGGVVNGPVVPKAAITLSQSGGNVAIDATLGNLFDLTITASGWTILAPTGGLDGQVIRLRSIMGTGGSFTITWAAGWNWGAAGAPTLSTAAGTRDRVVAEFVSSGGTTAPCWDAAVDLGH